MDTSDPDIVFDADGVCNHCTAWFARADLHRLPREERARLLETRVEEIKRREREREKAERQRPKLEIPRRERPDDEEDGSSDDSRTPGRGVVVIDL